MTAKNRIPIPKNLTNAQFRKGFTRKEYAKLEMISATEKGQEKPAMEKFIRNLKEGKD